MRKGTVVLLVLSLVMLFASCKAGQEKDRDIQKVFGTVCSADEALALAKSSDVVVFEDERCTSGQDIWDGFYSDVSAGKEASVLCAHYYTLDREYVSAELYEQEKDLYPQLFFTLLRFDGSQYSIEVRMSTSPEIEEEETYNCLLHYTGNAPTPDALYDRYDHYVLTDDPDVTWEEITSSMLDSSTPEFIRHSTVYSNYFD